MDEILHFIAGKRVAGVSRRTSLVYDPSKGEAVASVVLGCKADLDLAVDASLKAYETWRESSLSKRAQILFTYRELLERHIGELAEMITTQHGKVLSDAEGEVRRGLEVVEFACGIPHLLKGELSDSVSRSVDAYSLRQPLGVVAGVTPFNFPAMVPMWMFPLAIACGNAFVLKPSEKDPSLAVRLAELFMEAGLPEGVFNVVHGDKEMVDAILLHPEIKAVSFVGSTPVAKYIYQRSAENGKRVQALGGAKNHMFVASDADLSAAADAAVSAAYGSAGERCMAISVVVVDDLVADEFVNLVAERTKNLRVGSGLDPNSEMGPLVTKEHRDKVASYVDGASMEGARVVVDGREVIDQLSPGFYLGPSLIDGVTKEMKVYRDEIFGPVLSVVRVSGVDEAVRFINSNPYANGAAIFTRSGYLARRFKREIDAGMVGINVPIPVPVAYFSFGGSKDSLFGDTHMHGMEGVRFFTRLKAVTERWFEEDSSASRGVNLNFPGTR
ncbi:methylmalonate-semialdehyde dehydrogenase [acylating] [Ferrithrix thermotolerans DSM 19514]|jgi:malonate-semialdehyde dehydrogenase (acetylating)/methylmalonate-semialdehyde dehydrogenase|uniref:methylmalonate-semialdehyde dehydrogenase (CoA acylating) n=1 Tax=Ferrithrix thermotolerans DSM 19514 TaxID=1121881 RepID=A0A1M4SHQ7_9ACTN|nr:CoA-acylating methylmalonate-semialdehyde dehydrogenase [Ferrithrix thermotolerans]SHE31804.1 methylmalonate-semialdehyde dehydrogenase [acylating] [Ferrithrix thermotolerans DSM 19514]